MEIYANFSVRYGLEPRFPFRDRRLAAFCLAIPPGQKLKAGYSRRVAREALVDYLPKKTFLRSGKADLSWNFLQGMRSDQDCLKSILARSHQEVEAIFDLSAIRSMVQQVIQGVNSNEYGQQIFLSTAIIAWMNSGGVGKDNQKEEVTGWNKAKFS
jgi:asparagine synthase (glutamine-hydrolysing)